MSEKRIRQFPRRGLCRSAGGALAMAAALACGGGAHGQSLTDGLVGWWKFEEGSGTLAADSSGYANTGVLSNGPTWTSGPTNFGKALFFDGANDFVNIPDSASLGISSAMSISFWMKADPAVLTNWPRVIQKGIYEGSVGEYWVYISPPSTNLSVQYRYSNGGVTTAFVTNAAALMNAWHHCAITYDGTKGRMYFDGKKVNEVVQSGTIANTSHPLNIGRDGSSGTGYFRGGIDDVRVYDRALSDAEVGVLVLPSDKYFSSSGAVSGGSTGPIHVLASSNRWSWSGMASTTLASVGAFTLAGTNFSDGFLWFRAFRDLNSNGVWELGEHRTEFVGNPVVGTGYISGVTLELPAIADADRDGMPDDWEMAHGLNPTNELPFAGFRAEATLPGYGETESLNDFPALLVLSTNIGGFSYTNFASANGWDLRLRERETLQELPYEIESWDTNGSSAVWVRIPALGTNGVSVIATWGLSNDTQAGYTTDGSVWASSFESVHHMGGQGAACPDSKNQYNGTMVNMEPADRAAGAIGKSLFFGGVDEYVALPSGYIDFRQGMTISFWAQHPGGGSGETLFYFGNAHDVASVRGYRYSGSGYSWWYDYANLGRPQLCFSPGPGWNHYAAVSGTDGILRLYANGAEVSSVQEWPLPSLVARGLNYFGRGSSETTGFYVGGLDEVRVERVPRSAMWLRGVWNNQRNNGSSVVWSRASSSPVVPDTDGDGLDDLGEYGRGTDPRDVDSDDDGMPDGWEVGQGLDPKVNDAAMDKDGDGLVNDLELRLGSSAASEDSDRDNLRDAAEFGVYGSLPGNEDTDGDRMLDDWEVANGLNPTLNDAAEDRDLDGLTNLEEWNLRQQGYLAGNADSDGDGKSDYENRWGRKAERYYYDRIDRLVGADYNHGSNGLAIAYVYDGNGNIRRQVYLKRDADRDGIPDIREFLDGVSTSNANSYADSDGDGWSDWQEWKAGSGAGDLGSTPETLSVLGASLGSFNPGFAASNFVMGVGQLDGAGSEEIVVGADGNPGGMTNSILILSEVGGQWATQRVAVGAFGITSIAVGRISSNAAPAVFLGTRVAGGTGTVWEVKRTVASWTATGMELGTTGEVAYVLGMRDGVELFASLSATNSGRQAMFSLQSESNGWLKVPIWSNACDRGIGVADWRGVHGEDPVVARISETGILEATVPERTIGYSSDYKKWYAVSRFAQSWSNSLALARLRGGVLAGVDDAQQNRFLRSLLAGYNLWLGISRSTGSDMNNPTSWTRVNGSTSTYTNWALGEPNGASELCVAMNADGRWFDAAQGASYVGAFEYSNSCAASIEPATGMNEILWPRGTLASGFLRSTNGVSVIRASVEDLSGDGAVGMGDEFVTREYLVLGTNWVSRTVQRTLLESGALASSYAVACADYLKASNDVLFAAGPDGRVYASRAPNPTNDLVRTVFSEHYLGKAWHQLAARGEAAGGEGLAGLWVDPTNASLCHVAYFAPAKELWTPPVIPQTSPMTSVMVSSNAHGGNASVDVRIWDAEGNPSAVAMQFSTNGGAAWGSATILTLDGQAYSPSAYVEAQPGGTTHGAVWSARGDVGSGYQGTVLLRAQARDRSGLGAWSVAVPYAMTIDIADLELSMGDAPDPVVQGQELTYSLTLANNGPTEAPGTAVAVTLPGGVSFVSAVASQGTCTPSGGAVECDLGLLGNGASATITIKVRPNAAEEIEASAIAGHAGNDPVSGNNTADVSTTVNGSDQLVVSPEVLDLGGVVFGGWAEGTFTLSNTGPSSVSGTAAMPAGAFEIVSGSPYDLAGHAVGEVVVRFTPSGNGSFAEDVIFESNGGTRTNRAVGLGADLPAPDFTASPTNGAAPLAVLFTDLTSASVTNRLWQFGDGGSASVTSSNVVYVYHLPGTNTVTLTVQGPGGSSSVTKSNLIVVAMYPPGDVNGDGRVTGADSLLINQALVPPGLRQTNDAVFAKAGFRNGDVNQDGQVTGADSLRINQVMVQLRSFVVTKVLPSWRSNSAPTAVAVYGIGFPTQAVSGVTIGPPVSLSLSNVTAISREEIRGVVPGGGGTGTGTVSVIAFPSNSVISTGNFENR